MEEKSVVLVIHLPFKPDAFPLPGHTSCKPHQGFHKEKAGVHSQSHTASFFSFRLPHPLLSKRLLQSSASNIRVECLAAHTSKQNSTQSELERRSRAGKIQHLTTVHSLSFIIQSLTKGIADFLDLTAYQREVSKRKKREWKSGQMIAVSHLQLSPCVGRKFLKAPGRAYTYFIISLYQRCMSLRMARGVIYLKRKEKSNSQRQKVG